MKKSELCESINGNPTTPRPSILDDIPYDVLELKAIINGEDFALFNGLCGMPRPYRSIHPKELMAMAMEAKLRKNILFLSLESSCDPTPFMPEIIGEPILNPTFGLRVTDFDSVPILHPIAP